MSGNTNLYNAKMKKNDEFYTRMEDIEKELPNYAGHFDGKVVLCNADDPEKSAFWRYFHENYESLGLKSLVATHIVPEGQSYIARYNGGNDHDLLDYEKIQMDGDGDFRSDECVLCLKEADIVVTNPPFSLFRDYIALMMQYGKKFLVVGSKNAITYKEVFPLLQDRKMWIGCNNVHKFLQPDGSIKSFGNIGWYTNLEMQTEDVPMELTERYYGDDGNPLSNIEDKYPHYDGYDAINVDRLKDIPCDYFGIMGVPITFLDKFRPPIERERESTRLLAI